MSLYFTGEKYIYHLLLRDKCHDSRAAHIFLSVKPIS